MKKINALLCMAGFFAILVIAAPQSAHAQLSGSGSNSNCTNSSGSGSSITGSSGSSGCFNGQQAASQIQQLQQNAGQAFLAGAVAWKYWAIIISTIAMIAMFLAAAWGHFKAQWSGKIVGGLLGFAVVSMIIAILTGVTLAI